MKWMSLAVIPYSGDTMGGSCYSSRFELSTLKESTFTVIPTVMVVSYIPNVWYVSDHTLGIIWLCPSWKFFFLGCHFLQHLLEISSAWAEGWDRRRWVGALKGCKQHGHVWAQLCDKWQTSPQACACCFSLIRSYREGVCIELSSISTSFSLFCYSYIFQVFL